MTWSGPRQRRWPAITAFLYCHGLGVSTVALPLLALAAGYSAQTVGLLVAGSAAAQIATRVWLVRVLHRLPERWLVVGSAVLLCAASAVVLPSESLPAFGAAHLLQGVSRALFWVGLQVQVVRSTEEPQRALAAVDFFSGAGMVTGPATIGVFGGSLTATLVAGIVVTAAAVVTTMGLEALPPAAPTPRQGQAAVWRRSGLSPALLAAISAGTWRGLLGSYVPVVLAAAGHVDATVGVVVALGSGAAVLGSMVAGFTRGRALRPAYLVAAATAGAGLVGLALWPGSAVAATLLLAGSGLGAGIMQTVSPALAARAVAPADRGPVVATVGTYRAWALLGSPLAVVGLLVAVPLGPAVAVVGSATALPLLRPPRPPADPPDPPTFPYPTGGDR